MLKTFVAETSEQIATPATWQGSLQYGRGGSVKFWAPQEAGKTIAMIACAFEIVEREKFIPGNRVFTNGAIAIPGSHWLTNREFRKICRRAFNTEVGKWQRCLFIAQEADDLWSHVDQSNKEAFTDLKALSQSYKRNIYFFWEMHEGRGVAKYLRDKTEISVRPINLTPDGKGMDLIVCNSHYMAPPYRIHVNNPAWCYDKFDRFEPLV